MTEFLGTDGGQIAYEVTGLTVAAEEVVAARPELVWDLVADITRVGRWSPECIRAAWLRGARPAAARRQVHRAQPVPGWLRVRGDLRGHRGGPAPRVRVGGLGRQR